MTAQQLNVDTIANNLANVNTYGYKKERLEFKTLLYETMKRASLDPANQSGQPVNLQVGHGVRPIAVSRIMMQGSLQRTDNPQDFSIEGDGFFAVMRNEEILYTKDGAFKLAPTDEGLMLTTSEGYPVLSTDEAPIIFGDEIIFADVTVDEYGMMYYAVDNQMVPLGIQFMLVQFPNAQGLEGIGSNFLRETTASGAPLLEAEGEVNRLSRLIQGVLEMSNVQVADEMVNLIVAQRAYDLNARAITTSDDMLNTANNLKRG
jgi:flagellar basal-body rod protein FlgG